MPNNDNIVWKDKTGTYKLGYSQKLMKEQVQWQKINFAGKIALIAVILILIIIVLFVLYRLDAVNFFSVVMDK
ncbi:MAG: hypothetical protein CMH62_00035 [Nanoarchaeota archaeon]|nr:hypothetical protein [Nanoarchaeota archaeon]